MRILLLACNRRYQNAHTELLPPLFAGVGDLVCFGPGFVDAATLAKGISAFVSGQARFDFIVTDHFVLMWHGNVVAEGGPPFIGSYINFEPKEHVEFAAEAAEFFFKCDITKVFFENMDLYKVPHELTEALKKCGAYVLGWGREFQTSVSSLKLQGREVPKCASDNYYQFTCDNAERSISLPFFVPGSDVSFAPLSRRPRRVTVPGTNYPERTEAIRRLRLQSIRDIVVRKLLSRWWRRQTVSWSRLDLALYRHRFMWHLEDSQICYVTGGCLRYFVRKCVEVPAKGCLMVCEEPIGFTEAGFVSGENCLVLSIDELVDYVTKRFAIDEAQRLASRGRNLILRQHTLERRVQQLSQALTAIQDGTFKGSRWVKGSFEVLR